MVFLIGLVLGPENVLQEKQDEELRRIGELIRKLGSEVLEEREEATQELRGLVEKAEEQLKQAAESPDAERAVRARELLAGLGARRELTENLLRAVPGLEWRLSAGGGTWAEVFLELMDEEGDPTKARITKADLERLGGGALERARTEGEAVEIIARVGMSELTGLAPSLSRSLGDRREDVRSMAAWALGELEAKDCVEELVLYWRIGNLRWCFAPRRAWRALALRAGSRLFWRESTARKDGTSAPISTRSTRCARRRNGGGCGRRRWKKSSGGSHGSGSRGR